MSRRLEVKTKKLASLFILLLLYACKIPACSSPELPEEPKVKIKLYFKGTVTDETTNSPIADVEIQLYRPTFLGDLICLKELTDQNGQYYVAYSREQTVGYNPSYYLRAVKDGYEEKRVEVKPNPDIQIVDFVLTPESQ
jgi:hypothetical protein